ncbi:FadR/GntR family transcriptional regulator [Gymnodinialimonas ceratoperidinii]|uniref:FCD domain-containing protein n=1 Tax=Gymnodinialimonas ceratoperidinii TaxID=2856823 RepID=A0A8F6Y941_9RHOB|nr:FCD domain-containing protein [Gymnodinialimonas ceratoperidinii]QXT38198.1 FCD domain-containing protein [Gymnodinialimonas ceratoperidinii]
MQDKNLIRLRRWIATSDMTRGARLPAERALSSTLGLSRAELRNALLVLEAEGVLERHVGRGTFLAKSPNAARNGRGMEATIATLSETTAPIDAMDARLALEPELTRLAAVNASPKQLRDLRRLSDDMRAAPTWAAYETLDHDFHAAIAAGSGNALLQTLSEILNGVRQVVVWRRLAPSQQRPEPEYHSFDEHDEIVAALESRDGVAAAKAMTRHLKSTRNALMETSED